jgi:hypothetical protein
MELPVTDPGINAPETLGILKKNGSGVAYGHIGLVGVGSFLLIHINHFIDLFFQVLSIGVGFKRGLSGGNQFFEILFDIFHGGWRWNATSRGDVGDERPCPRMSDMDHDIIVFDPFLAFETSAINLIFVPFFKNMIDTLKPSIRQVSRLDQLNLHLLPLWFLKIINLPSERLSTCLF